MAERKTELQKQIESKKQVLIAEYTPPKDINPEKVRNDIKKYAGKIHAVGISDNRSGVTMSALATASIFASEGVEPIMHMITRDRNRIALISDYLGAHALGIGSILCTTGTHQTLGNYCNAKNVFDIDSTQLLNTLTKLSENSSLVGEGKINGADPLFLGAVASPFADPLELQINRVKGKISAGAKYLITQPVFDIDRFETWWKEIVKNNIQESIAIICGIRILTDGTKALEYSKKRPNPMIPNVLVERLTSKSNESDQRLEGIKIALETIERIKSLSGIDGFSLSCHEDETTLLEIIDKIRN